MVTVLWLRLATIVVRFVDAHGILLYTENDYFYFSMHSSSLYSIFANWLYEHPRIHKYYMSSVRCHSSSQLEPVSLTLRTSLRLRQLKLNDSSRHEYCHVTSRTWSHALHEDISVYTKPVVMTRLDTVKFIRRNSWNPNHEDKAEILTLHEVVFKCYACHGKWIPYIQVSEDIICLASHWYTLSSSVQSFAWTPKVSWAWIYKFLHSINRSAVHSTTYRASQTAWWMPMHSTTVSPLQGRVRCPSVIKHEVTSQAYASSHLFHPIVRLIQFIQRSPHQLVFMIHYCYYPYQIRTNETGPTLNCMTLNEARQGLNPG